MNTPAKVAIGLAAASMIALALSIVGLLIAALIS